MGARSNIVLNDGQATPVAHTFAPTQDSVGGWSRFVDRSGGIAAGYPELRLRLTEPTPVPLGQVPRGSRIYMSDTRIIVPTLETLGTSSSGYTPPPSAAYSCSFRIQSFMPERSTQLERKNARAFAANWLACAVALLLYQDNEGVY